MRIYGSIVAAMMIASVIGACGGGSPPPVGPGSGTTPPPGGGSAGATGGASGGIPTVIGTKVGTAHPVVVEAAARDGAWIVICQARTDTDGDGEIAVHAGMHGDTYGDQFRPYLVRGAGEGEPIDSLVGYTRDGRWLVAMRAGKLALLDAHAGTWSEIAGADLRDDGVPLGPHRAASLATAGDRMTFFRDDETIVVRELSTGAEHTVKVAGARVWRVEVEPLGTWARVYAIRTDSDKDGKLTWPSVRSSLSDRDCRGPIMSYSTGGWSGDKPDELWLDLAAGTVSDQRSATAPSEPDDAEPAELGTHQGRPVLAVDRTGRKLLGPDDSGRAIPVGPLEWVTPD
jgi:hypothetical protein